MDVIDRKRFDGENEEDEENKLVGDWCALRDLCGPILYCAEGVDNGGKVYGATLPADATFVDELGCN